MEGMLLTTSWAEELKETLGLAGVSQVWKDQPNWYFWLAHGPGPFSLQLERTEVLPIPRSKIKRGLFSLKLFPYPHQEVLSRFSPEEREQIQSEHFDHTGTPRFQSLRQVPDNLFHIGILEWLLDQGQGTSTLVFDSLTSLRVRSADGSPVGLSEAKTSATPDPGRLIRDVPGWDLGIPFFDRLLCLYAYYRKQSPARIVLTRSPGFEHTLEKDGSLLERKADDIWGLAVLVCFVPPGRSLEKDARIQEQVEAFLGDSSPLADLSYPQGYHPPESAAEVPHLRINERWWSLADKTFSCKLSSTCGCAHE
jgi:hypothetical protein